MDFRLKIVTETPVKKLWTEAGYIDAVRGRNLKVDDIKADLPITQFVVADPGLKLKWIDHKETYTFWKDEVQKRVADNLNHIEARSFPENYSYIATEWTREADNKIVLLEKIH